jgi:hypothetical protein
LTDLPSPTHATDGVTYRLLRRGAYTLLLLYGTYLVAGNLLLNTPIGHRLANPKPEKAQVGWDRALTIIPTHVKVWNLRVAGNVRRTVWSVQADQASGRLALLPLLRRTISVRGLVGEQVSGGASLIDNPRPASEARPGGWTLEFDEISVQSMRHAYFNDLVLVGEGRVTGGFRKTMRGGATELLPTEFEVPDAVLWREGTALLREAKLTGTIAMAPNTRAEAPGVRKLLWLDADVAVDGVTPGLRILVDDQQRPQLVPTDRQGQVSAQLGWRRGQLRPGTSVQFDAPVDASVAGKEVPGSSELLMQVDERQVELKAKLGTGSASHFHADADLVMSGTSIPIPIESVTEIVSRTAGHVDATWQFQSLSWLTGLIRAPALVSFDGSGSIVADLTIADGKIAAGSRLDVPAVTAVVSAMGNDFSGAAQAEIAFEPAERVNGVRPRLRARMQEFRVAPGDSPQNPYVEGHDLKLEVTVDDMEGELKDSYRAHLVFNDADVPDLRVYNRYLPNQQVRILAGAGLLSGDLRLDGEGQVGRGELRVAANDARIDVAGIGLKGSLQTDVRLRRADLANRNLDASGSRIALKGLSVEAPADQARSDWWATLELAAATLDLDKRAALDARLNVSMKDLSVLLELFAQKKHFPHWVANVVDEGQADMSGHLRWKDQALVLDRFSGSNDRFHAQARLRLHDGQRKGDLYLGWHKLGLGLELDGENRDFRFIQPRKWFESRPDLLPH